MKNLQKGFTIIELVIVIVILGILAAFAIPRFVNLGSSAKTSAIQGMTGSVRSASALAHSQWLASGSTGTSGTITVDGNPITMLYGYPTGTGIVGMIQDTSGYAVSTSAADATFARSDATTPADCRVIYNQSTAAGAAPELDIDTDGC
jgi:MSHA pilin protein MshA